MTRWLAMIVVTLVLACAANAGAQPKAPKAENDSSDPKTTPLLLYLAKGEPNACGHGCSEWVAIEGSFDSDAGFRAQVFLARLEARGLPVYLHSPGGNTAAALVLGRFLRQHGITAGVAATIPRGCASAFDESDACRALKRSRQPVVADLRPDVTCSSACVWALLGAKVRHVPPGARLGVHAGKLTLMRKSADGRVRAFPPEQYSALYKRRNDQIVASTRRYISEMGIDTRVLEVAQNVPHEDVRYLNRDEIAAFGIDGRDFVETPWFFAQFSNGSAYVSKWIVEARGPERKEHRVSVVVLRCLGASRIVVQYLRGLASDEIGRAAIATFSIGKQKARVTLNGGSKRDTIDTGGLFANGTSAVAFADFEAAASQAAIRVTESDPRLDTKLFNVVELSTDGLVASLKQMREKCWGAAQAPSWGDGNSVPFVNEQAGSPARAPASAPQQPPRQ
jgi:hypothetical protein